METIAEGDLEELKQSGEYLYFQPEAWRNDKEEERKAILEKGNAVEIGDIGYSGQSGIYIPQEFADYPFQGRFYVAFNSSRETNADLYKEAAISYPNLTEDCAAGLEQKGNCFPSTKRVVSALFSQPYEKGSTDQKCDLWCTNGSMRGSPKIPLMLTGHKIGWLDTKLALTPS